MAAPAHVDIRRLNKNVTMTVTLTETREWRVRRWLALGLIRMATTVLGCRLEIADSQEMD